MKFFAAENGSTMNEAIIKLRDSYLLGGGYTWNPQTGGDGVTMNLEYKGKKIASKDKDTYCCGLNFELWFRVIGSTVDLPLTEMQKVRALWYCARANRGGCMDALTSVRLGLRIPTINEARDGDFCQFWRKSGSGHSVNLKSFDLAAGTFTYWSTQPKTDGIGYRTERLENMSDLFFVRALNQSVDFHE